MSFQERIDRHFDDAAEFWKDVYDDRGLLGTIFRERRDRALAWIESLPLEREARVLEVGCGAGSLAIELGRRGYLVDAIDPSGTMIELARREIEQAGVSVELSVGDVHDLDFPAGHFGIVVALGVLPWVHSPPDALAEMARVLRSGGVVVFSCDNRAALQLLLDPRLHPAVDRFKARIRRTLSRAEPPGRFTSREIGQLLELAQLGELERRTIQFGPFTFLGARLLGERTGIRLHMFLQRLADTGFPVVRSAGMQHIVLARKT